MKKKIDKAEVPSLSEMQEMAVLEGVGLIACHMAISIMEIDESKLVDGVVVWNADQFLRYARTCEICLYT
jgi:peroxiredoxin family protein